MNTWLRPLLLIMAALSLLGCTASPYTYTGAALGGGLGAGTGAIIDRNNPWRGAAFGALIGGVLGGVGGEVVRQNRAPSQPHGYYQPGYAPRYGSGAPPAAYGQDPNAGRHYSQAPGGHLAQPQQAPQAPSGYAARPQQAPQSPPSAQYREPAPAIHYY